MKTRTPITCSSPARALPVVLLALALLYVSACCPVCGKESSEPFRVREERATVGKAARSPEEIGPVSVGDAAPDAPVRTAAGEPVRLQMMFTGRPTLLVFYRGDWCPSCKRKLREVESVRADLKRMDVQVLAISPDQPKYAAQTAHEVGAGFPLLSDSDAAAARAYGVAWRLGARTYREYRDRWGVDIEAFSGRDHHQVPVGSLFLIDRSGVLRWRYVHPDPARSPSGAEIRVAVVKALRAGRGSDKNQ